ncbi:BZ3500_MvSof-1268-A1-R1_Chr4-2g07024 [Microbotryum saponariae]|uniref:BZ3500_MvSof-1268-A1-R1_Chr4-2g07024 protein n=1 Tax=Microbotryum saponariae TaxID=289078 RepID=A0A2X0LL80_9BASI|nr:BZ3500_MvSof-1268-A1-R1_Chr4-2g07024 [Microbotryum saponariae]SDA06689.1 BZ3501_MvSof-1269-A2-R1_Chr4-2g06735 [Microbotryum saponariae]
MPKATILRSVTVRVLVTFVTLLVFLSTLAAADAVDHPKLRVKGGLGRAGTPAEVIASAAASVTGSNSKSYPRGYSAVIAFGASYMGESSASSEVQPTPCSTIPRRAISRMGHRFTLTDNAHKRSKKYATSFRDQQEYPFSDQGRYTNGPVAVEYMVKPSTNPALRPFQIEPPVLFDFAYGGSVIKNNLTGTAGPHNIPDLGREVRCSSRSRRFRGKELTGPLRQIKQYLEQLDDEVIDPGRGRVLHVIHTGTNPISQMWLHALTANITHAKTRRSIGKQVTQMAKYIRYLATHDSLRDNVVVDDYLIVGVPPLSIVPNLYFNYIAAFPNHTAAQRDAALEYAGELVDLFNVELEAFTSNLKAYVKPGSRVLYYDLANLFKTIYRFPRAYGITHPVTQACWNSSTRVLCKDPEHHLYIDTLHPTTSAHKIWASRMNRLVNKVARQADAKTLETTVEDDPTTADHPSSKTDDEPSSSPGDLRC